MQPAKRARLVFPLLALLLSACGGKSPSGPTPPPVPPADTTFKVAAFREAGRITAAAAIEVQRLQHAGLFEGDIKRFIDSVFSREGSGPPAFPHIVAAGPNAIELHYAGDARQTVDGEFLLIDIGATWDSHCSDLSRTYPVSGRFTSRQLDIYRLVLDGEEFAARSARVGVDTLGTLDRAVRDFFRASGLTAKNNGGVEMPIDAFFIHALSHYVGREVHGGDTHWSPTSPIAVGQVFTIEPGLYIPSEGTGIRIEDTFLVTSTGLECLTCAAPKDPTQVARAW